MHPAVFGTATYRKPSGDALPRLTLRGCVVTRQPTSSRDLANQGEPIVFVVDDDSSMRGALKSLLGSVGLRVEMFGSAPGFLQSRLPSVPSCLVLDIRLPGVSGLDFQDDLAKADIHIPIIFMTGHGDIPMSVKAMKAGAVDFLTKPFRDQDMLDAVTKALERDRKRRRPNSQSGFTRPNIPDVPTSSCSISKA